MGASELCTVLQILSRTDSSLAEKDYICFGHTAMETHKIQKNVIVFIPLPFSAAEFSVHNIGFLVWVSKGMF